MNVKDFCKLLLVDDIEIEFRYVNNSDSINRFYATVDEIARDETIINAEIQSIRIGKNESLIVYII